MLIFLYEYVQLPVKSLGGGTLYVNSGYLCGSGLGVIFFFFSLAFIYLFRKFRIHLLISLRHSTIIGCIMVDKIDIVSVIRDYTCKLTASSLHVLIFLR